jgi:DNA-binding protein Fis
VVLSKGEVLELPSLEEPGLTRANGFSLRRLEDVEAEHIQKVLDSVDWHQGRACDILGISRPTLRKKIRDYKLKETISVKG